MLLLCSLCVMCAIDEGGRDDEEFILSNLFDEDRNAGQLGKWLTSGGVVNKKSLGLL